MVKERNVTIRGRVIPANKTQKGLRFKSKSTNKYTTSKRLYSMTGEAVFIILVTSVGDGRVQRTRETVLSTSSNVRENFKQMIEKAKTSAKASHYDRLGYDMTDFSGKLIKRLVYFKLLDYIIKYNRFYDVNTKKPRFTFKSEISRRKVRGKTVVTRFNKIYEYNVVKKKYVVGKDFYGRKMVEEDYSTSKIRQTLRDYELAYGESSKSEFREQLFDEKFRFAQNNK